MKFPRKSISVKISGLYIMLAVINMSFFTVIIYENQVDLIAENTKYRMTELADSLVSSLEKIGREKRPLKDRAYSKRITEEIAALTGNFTDSFIIFSGTGEVIYRSSENIIFSRNDILNGIRAVTNRDFTGKRFYTSADDKTYEISFYIPLNAYGSDGAVLYARFRMDDISYRLSQMYRLITVIIILVALFHLFFAVILFRVFVKPVKHLHGKSLAISRGNLSERSEIKRDDEIGDLSSAFNAMAEAVEEKILTLKGQYEQIEAEIEMASRVQDVIFPEIVNNERFNFSVYSKPVDKVSGDYYDIFDLGDRNYGFLIVDVQGHGLPAAMITMIIKEKFRMYTPIYRDPAELIKVINSEIIGIIEEMEKESALFFTAFYMIIDENSTILSVDAGHICPFLIRKERKRIELLKSGGIPIGISREMDNMYITFKTQAESGDKIVLYTDGIIEARNSGKKQYGMSGVIKSLKKNYREPADSLLKAILRDLAGFTNINMLKDDATLFIIELK